MTLPIEYQNLIARRALEVVEPTPGAVDRFRAHRRPNTRQFQFLRADIRAKLVAPMIVRAVPRRRDD